VSGNKWKLRGSLMCVKVWRSVSWRKDTELGCKLGERVVSQLWHSKGRLSPSECSHLTLEQIWMS
jgi:hypothetical protein